MGILFDREATPAKLIKITSPTTEYTIQNLYNDIRDWEHEIWNMSYDPIIPLGYAAGKFNLGDVISGIIMALSNEWRIQFWNGVSQALIKSGTLVMTSGYNNYPLEPTGGGDSVFVANQYGGVIAQVGSGVTEQDKTDIIEGVWDEVLTAPTHNIQYSSGRRLRALGEVQVGSINDPSPTTTDFITDLTQSINKFYDDQYIIFTSGALEGIVRIIADYNSTTKSIHLVKALPQAPANGDDFEIRPEHIHSLDDITNAILDEDITKHTSADSVGKELSDVKKKIAPLY